MAQLWVPANHEELQVEEFKSEPCSSEDAARDDVALQVMHSLSKPGVARRWIECECLFRYDLIERIRTNLIPRTQLDSPTGRGVGMLA